MYLAYYITVKQPCAKLSSCHFLGPLQIGDQVAKNLHDDPQLWRLSDAAVASLGCWPFAEQAKEVSRQGEVSTFGTLNWDEVSFKSFLYFSTL